MLALARTDDALSMAYIAAGALNENISINPDGTLSGAGGGQVQIGQLPGSVAVGQLTANLAVAMNAVFANLAAINADLGTVTAGKLNLSAQTFTPSWTGFSSAPAGDLKYIDFGAFVLLWTDATLLGTSNASDMTITNLPAAIRPSSYRYVQCLVVNNSAPALGAAYYDPANPAVLDFRNAANFPTGAFQASGFKGLREGTTLTYPK